MSEYYLLEPILCGEVELNFKKKESEQIIIIDLISQDDIIYCADGCFLITARLLKSLKEANLKGVNILKPQHIKFSAQHNIAYPNQTMPEWYRLIPFEYDGSNTQEMFLNEEGKLIINDRINQVLREKLDCESNDFKHRLIRMKRYSYDLNDLENHEDESEEREVFKKDKSTLIGELAIFMITIITVAYLFFK